LRSRLAICTSSCGCPSFGTKKLHLFAAAPSSAAIADDPCLFDLLREHHLFRDGGGFGVELGDELLHHLGVRRVLRAFEDEVLAPDQFSAADEEDLHAGFAVAARHGEHVRVEVIGGKDDRCLSMMAWMALSWSRRAAAFSKRISSEAFSISLSSRDDALAVSAEEIHQVGDHLAVPAWDAAPIQGAVHSLMS
jgi:hypothetical protein